MRGSWSAIWLGFMGLFGKEVSGSNTFSIWGCLFLEVSMFNLLFSLLFFQAAKKNTKLQLDSYTTPTGWHIPQVKV